MSTHADTGRRLKLTPGESIEIVRSEPDRLEVTVIYSPGGKRPPAHYHPEQDEHFEVHEGTLIARVDGEDVTLKSGDQLEVPRGAVHQFWNEGDEPVRATWVTTPRGRTEQWFEELGALQREGRVDRNGMPGPLAFGVLLTEYRDVFRLAAKPEPVVRAGLSVMGAIGRRRGYTTRG